MGILDDLARVVAPKSDQKTPVIPNPETSGGIGVIVAVNTDGTVNLQYHGAIFPANVTNDYVPKVGQTTLVATYGTQVWAVGSGAIGLGEGIEWGAASTAQFSFAGNPNGSVVAESKGDLCVDTSTPAVWQAIGIGSIWELIAGRGDFPDYEGTGDPNGVQSGSDGQWYKDIQTGELYMCMATGNSWWTVVNPGRTFGYYEYSAIDMRFGFQNTVEADSGFALAIGWGNDIIDGINAIALGSSTVTGTGIAIGSASADGYHAVAIGYGADANNNDQFSLGGTGSFITIGNSLSVFYHPATGSPNGSVTALAQGDICGSLDGLYQAGAADDVSWILVSGGSGGVVDSVVPGTGISVDDTDPANPIVSLTGSAVNVFTTSFTADSYTLEGGDADSVQMADNGSSAGTIVVPPNSDTPFDIGTFFSIIQPNTGAISITEGAGVTIISSVSGGFVSGTTGCRVQGSTIGLLQVAVDTWYLSGDAA